MSTSAVTASVAPPRRRSDPPARRGATHGSVPARIEDAKIPTVARAPLGPKVAGIARAIGTRVVPPLVVLALLLIIWQLLDDMCALLYYCFDGWQPCATLAAALGMLCIMDARSRTRTMSTHLLLAGTPMVSHYRQC